MALTWHVAMSCDRCGEVLSRRVSPYDPWLVPVADDWIVMPLHGTAATEHICPDCRTEDDEVASLQLDLDDWAAPDGEKWADVIAARTLAPYLNYGGGS